MRYRRPQHTAWRSVLDETIVIDLEAHHIYAFNPSGGWLWQELGDGRGVDELRAALTAGDGARASAVQGFVDQLVELRLLVEVSDPAEAGKDGSEPPAPAPPAGAEAPALLWQEPVRKAAATCAFLPGQSPLCNQVPFS